MDDTNITQSEWTQSDLICIAQEYQEEHDEHHISMHTTEHTKFPNNWYNMRTWSINHLVSYILTLKVKGLYIK